MLITNWLCTSLRKSRWNHPWIHTCEENGFWLGIVSDLLELEHHLSSGCVPVTHNASQYSLHSQLIHTSSSYFTCDGSNITLLRFAWSWKLLRILLWWSLKCFKVALLAKDSTLHNISNAHLHDHLHIANLRHKQEPQLNIYLLSE